MTTVVTASLAAVTAPNSTATPTTSGGVTTELGQESFTQVLSGQTSLASSSAEKPTDTPANASSTNPQTTAFASGISQSPDTTPGADAAGTAPIVTLPALVTTDTATTVTSLDIAAATPAQSEVTTLARTDGAAVAEVGSQGVVTSATPVAAGLLSATSPSSQALTSSIVDGVSAGVQVIAPSKIENLIGAPRDTKSPVAKPSVVSPVKKEASHAVAANHANGPIDAGAQGVVSSVTPPPTPPVSSRVASLMHRGLADPSPSVTSDASPITARVTPEAIIANTSVSATATSSTPPTPGDSHGANETFAIAGPVGPSLIPAASGAPQEASAGRNASGSAATPSPKTPEATLALAMPGVVASESGTGASSSSSNQSTSLPGEAITRTVAPSPVASASLPLANSQGPTLSSILQAAPSGRAGTSSASDNVPGRRSLKSPSDIASSSPTTNQVPAQGVRLHSGDALSVSGAPGATHADSAGASSSLDASKSINSSTNVSTHGLVASSLSGRGSALDVSGLTSVISRPLSEGNGTYTVTLAMHPAELGHVQAVMTLTGSELQVSLTPHTDHGHAALAVAINDLKNELARGGVNVNIDLRHPQSQMSSGDRRSDTPDNQDRPIAPATTFVAPSAPTRDAGQIHLML